MEVSYAEKIILATRRGDYSTGIVQVRDLLLEITANKDFLTTLAKKLNLSEVELLEEVKRIGIRTRKRRSAYGRYLDDQDSLRRRKKVP